MKSKLLKLLMGAVFIGGIVTVYRYFNEDMTGFEQARIESEMSFFESAHGVTRYEEYGDSKHPTIVLIHSFNGFLESWEPNIQGLVVAGYHVVAYDLFGRGLSDRPRVKYDLQVFRNQLERLLEVTETDKVHLVGASFGAVIAADFTLNHPDKVDGLVMVGPAGWPDEVGSPVLLKVPLLGEFVFHYWGVPILLPKVKDYFMDYSDYTSVIDKWQYFANFPGFNRASLSILRHAPVMDYLEGWKSLGRLNKQVLFVWGKQDISFPYENTKKLATLIPKAHVTGIENAAHWVNVEQPTAVNSAMVTFLKSLNQ